MARNTHSKNERHTCQKCGNIDLTVRPSLRVTNRGAICKFCRR
jgi:hypothetical protein